jgi:hypothetical protein
MARYTDTRSQFFTGLVGSGIESVESAFDDRPNGPACRDSEVLFRNVVSPLGRPTPVGEARLEREHEFVPGEFGVDYDRGSSRSVRGGASEPPPTTAWSIGITEISPAGLLNPNEFAFDAEVVVVAPPALSFLGRNKNSHGRDVKNTYRHEIAVAFATVARCHHRSARRRSLPIRLALIAQANKETT